MWVIDSHLWRGGCQTHDDTRKTGSVLFRANAQKELQAWDDHRAMNAPSEGGVKSTSLLFTSMAPKVNESWNDIITGFSKNKSGASEEPKENRAAEDRGFRFTPSGSDAPFFQTFYLGDLGGTPKYRTFKSDSLECGILKSEINEAYSGLFAGSEQNTGPLSRGGVVKIFRVDDYIKSLTDAIQQECHPATEQDLLDAKEKTIFKLTPRDVHDFFKKKK